MYSAQPLLLSGPVVRASTPSPHPNSCLVGENLLKLCCLLFKGPPNSRCLWLLLFVLCCLFSLMAPWQWS
ncbi:hypothetical protein AMECASPLE_036085 [Ameca splendens]|uniref:Uncharacterized protein n=1 Tax=Ameca splendens TaxID=208324 RepID=A0ABV1ADX4_9TELE